VTLLGLYLLDNDQ